MDPSQTTDSTAAVAALFGMLLPLYLLIFVVVIVALWRVFTKAGKPGWAAIIPIYNVWVLAEIAGKPGWWGLVISFAPIIPLVGVVVSLVMSLLLSIELAKKFGKSTAFGVVGLWIFSLIGYLILAFGDAKYEGVATQTTLAPQGGTPEIFNNPSQSEEENTPTSPEKPSEQPPTNPTPPPSNLVQ